MTREEAIRRLDGMKSLYPYENNPHKEAIDMAIEALQRPQGKWIKTHEDGHGYWVGTCSNCGKYSMEVRNFCPNCGADMKGKNNDHSY